MRFPLSAPKTEDDSVDILGLVGDARNFVTRLKCSAHTLVGGNSHWMHPQTGHSVSSGSSLEPVSWSSSPVQAVRLPMKPLIPASEKSVDLVSELSHGISRLQTTIVKLRGLGHRLGGPNDNEEFRKQLRGQRAVAKTGCQQINSRLAEGMRSEDTNKAQLSKLRRDFEQLLKQLTKLNEETIAKERKIVKRLSGTRGVGGSESRPSKGGVFSGHEVGEQARPVNASHCERG